MTSTISALRPSPAPVRVTVIDDSDLAQAGVRTLLAPFSERVVIIDNTQALAAPTEVDVVLFEPDTRSSMALSMMRDLQQRGDAAIAAFSWCDTQGAIPSTLPLLSKRLTASQLTVKICALAEERAAGQVADTACIVEAMTLSRQREVAAAASSTPSRPTPSASTPDAGLTGREHDVLVQVAQGRTNLEIGEELGLSINSVKTYIRSAYRKIGATRRPQAVIWALAHGLADVPSDGLAG